MAEGVRTFTTEGKTAVGFNSKPVTPGDYDAKLLDTTEVKCSAGGYPRVTTRWELLNTGTEGGKNRLLFHDFYTSLKPGNDGVAMPDRADQIVGMTNALGERFTTASIIQAEGDKGTVDCIDPRSLQDWLQSKAGEIMRLHVKIEKGTGGYSDKNKLTHFIAPETNGAVGVGQRTTTQPSGLA